MSNDYRSKDNSGSGWYYSDDNRFIPQSIVERERKRRERRRSPRPPAVPREDFRPGARQPYVSPEDVPQETPKSSNRLAGLVFGVSLTLLVLLLAGMIGYYVYLKF